MRLLLFAGLRESCGGETLEVDVDAPVTVRELRAAAERQHPALAGAVYRVAVAQRYAHDDDEVPAGAEVALLPPVSGG